MSQYLTVSTDRNLAQLSFERCVKVLRGDAARSNSLFRGTGTSVGPKMRQGLVVTQTRVFETGIIVIMRRWGYSPRIFWGQRGLDDLDHVVQVQPFRGADRGDADFIAAPQELISRRSRVVAVGDNVLRPVTPRHILALLQSGMASDLLSGA